MSAASSSVPSSRGSWWESGKSVQNRGRPCALLPEPTLGSVSSFSLHDLVVDEIENRVRKCRRDDEHGEVVGDAAGPSDPGGEEQDAREHDELDHVHEAWKLHRARG